MTDAVLRVILKRGKSKPLWLGHPWVYSGAIAHVDGPVGDMGAPCDLIDERGNVVGRGFYNPHGKVAVRLLQHRRSTDLPFDPRPFGELLESALSAAVSRRVALGFPKPGTDGYRLVNSEGDGLSGLIVDRFGDTVVAHLNSRAMYEQRDLIVRQLARIAGVTRVVSAVNEESSRLEAIPVGVEVAHGVRGTTAFEENGVRYALDLAKGQKTGFYLDQRENRRGFVELAGGKRFLDLYCYVGAFGVGAALAGATSVLAVDSSQPACDAATAHAALNGVSGHVRVECADAMTVIKQLAAQGETFDRIVCDPPKFARGRSHVGDALKKYIRLNTIAMSLLSEGGLLLSCSCSRHISEHDFLRMLTEAGHRLRRGVVVHSLASQPVDHPFSAVAPEGRYLKAALVSLGS